MKIAKLSGSQTTVLANLGVDMTADVFIPSGKGAGTYTFCTYCIHQGFEQIGDEAIRVCTNPAVDTGISTAQCYWKGRPITEGAALESVGSGGKDVPEDDLDRSFLVTGDGGNVTASKDVQGTIEKSTFHTQDSEGD
jgi:hypothetical protein